MKKSLNLLTLSLLITNASAVTDYSISFENFVSNTKFDSQNSLNGGQWYDGITGLVYTDALSGSGFDVSAVLAATSTYYPRNASVNGNNGGDDAKINMRRDRGVDFTFSMYDNETGNIVDQDFFGDDFTYSLIFYDLDGTTIGGLEEVTSYDHSSWEKTDNSIINIVETSEKTIASTNGTINNIPNTTAATTTLTAEQQSSAILFNYENKGSVNLNFNIEGGDPQNQRNLAIDSNTFKIFTEATVSSAVPEPKLAMLLGMGVICMIFRKTR